MPVAKVRSRRPTNHLWGVRASFEDRRIGIDLNGHAIIGPGNPGTVGILNPGYDHVGISGYAGNFGGRVRGFDHGIELKKGANNNEIVGMHVRGGHYGLVMYDSSDGRLDDNLITAGAKDGYDGGFGAAFADVARVLAVDERRYRREPGLRERLVRPVPGHQLRPNVAIVTLPCPVASGDG